MQIIDRASLANRLPFFYGYVILVCAMCASFARQATSVSTLSVFIVPMTLHFDWSRAEMSGAVSLGGILAALVAPMFGQIVDRKGARAVLTFSSIAIAAAALALCATHSLLWFYIFFSLGRMLFAGPFDIAVSAAVANWFVRRRSQAMSIISLTIGFSLAIMPVIAQLAIDVQGWRGGWVAIAVSVLVVGALPNALLMVRRPEDIGQLPDGGPQPIEPSNQGALRASPSNELTFNLRQAMRTPALWLLMIFTAIIFMVQAGLSLHQAPHMIQRGIDPTIAASIISAFALSVAAGSVLFGFLGGRFPVRIGLALSAGLMAVGALLTYLVTGSVSGFVSAMVFGTGIGGILTLTPVAFANYFGRESYGSIRGVALPVQVLGQAVGPVFAGIMFDLNNNYDSVMLVFAGLALLAACFAVFTYPPLQTKSNTYNVLSD